MKTPLEFVNKLKGMALPGWMLEELADVDFGPCRWRKCVMPDTYNPGCCGRYVDKQEGEFCQFCARPVRGSDDM